MSSLVELGNKHRTDKGTWHHGYTLFYDGLFLPLKERPVTLLEVGVYKGASMQMWDEYFIHPDSRFIGIDVGIDVDPRTLWVSPRVEFHKADATTQEVVDIVGDRMLTIVIDDGSHLSEHQRKTYELLYPRVDAGGLYVIEDTHCQSRNWKHYDACNSMGFNFVEWIKENAPGELTYAGSKCYPRCYPSIVVVRKR